MNRLDTIVTRQRKNRILDTVFAALVMLAGTIGAISVMTACEGASVVNISRTTGV